MISSGVAPAFSAPLMCRHVPGAYMCVIDASKAMLFNSLNLRRQVSALVNLRPQAEEVVGP
jgi:hypothetical protein